MNEKTLNTALRPLENIRVIDLSGHIAGPFTTDILGYLGADVIHIFAHDRTISTTGSQVLSEQEGQFWALRRNKRSLVVDLKKEEGRKVFHDLVRKTDVVFDNLRPGVMKRLGVDYPTLSAVNPRVIGCSLTGFGQEGPWAGVGAYDVTMQALSGTMAMTGTGDGTPCRWGVPVGDISASLYAVIGILAALEHRDQTGEGQYLDISMFDCQLALSSYRVAQYFGSDVPFSVPKPRRGGAGAIPYGPFLCGDGAWLVIGVGSNYWRSFCNAIGASELIDDSRFSSLALRQKNQDALDLILESHFTRETAATWEARLIQSGVPVGKVNTIQEAFEQPQAVYREMLTAFTADNGQKIYSASSPIKFAGEPAFGQSPPHRSGQDTEEILCGLLGYSTDQLETLRQSGVVTGGAA